MSAPRGTRLVIACTVLSSCIGKSKIDDGAIERLEERGWMVEELADLATLSHPAVDDELLSALPELTKEFERLDLHLTRLAQDRETPRPIASPVSDHGLEALSTLRNVTALDASKCSAISSAGVGHLVGWTKLRALVLRETGVDDDAFDAFGRLSALESLDLRDCTAVRGTNLTALAPLSKLQRLVLRGTNVDDDAVAALPPLPSLTVLILNDTRITDASLRTLATRTSLIELWVEETEVTDAGVEALETTLPELQVNY